jgi:uridine kinase
MNRLQLLFLLAERINEINCSHPLRVAVDGFDAAGKTTVSAELAISLQKMGRETIRASLDGFHNPRLFRYRQGKMSPEGYFQDSFDYQAVTERLLTPLGPRGDQWYETAVFDYRKNQPARVKPKMASRNAILLFDGIFLHRPKLIDFWEFSLFVDVTVEKVLERALIRDRSEPGPDGSSLRASDLRQRYLVRYIPAQQEYLRNCQPEEKADLVFDNNSLSSPFVASWKHDLR